MDKPKRIFIAGNGPSLKMVDFEDLHSIDWLGMNAAYRYWDKIKVYPTIYCCLDKVVVKSHAKEILRLHSQGQIKHFFMVKDILEVVPDFPVDDSVQFLEDLVASDEPGTEIFKTHFQDKKTTGSWAVRFAIYLGYRDIYLGGIDCNYVEIIDQAQLTGSGLELRINSEVDKNPNYFFDDYQKRGDTYQIPNPERHFGNLHLQSFEALNVDLSRLGCGVCIKNTAPGSQLDRYGVYERASLGEAVDRADLQAIAVPLVRAELPKLLQNFLLWDTPAFLPLRPDSPLLRKIALHIFFDCAYSSVLSQQIEEAWNKTSHLKNVFSRLEITFLGIPDELNHYIRDASCQDKPRKMGPNLHFLAIMRQCRRYRFTFLMETDCVPAKADWVTSLNSICANGNKFWISGGVLDALNTVSPAYALHINGNAIYATGDIEFQEFLTNVFIPALRYMILERRDYDLAYDCLISKLFAYGMSTVERKKQRIPSDETLMAFFFSVQRSLARFQPATWIKNLSHLDVSYRDEQLLALLEQDHVVIHSRKLDYLLTRTCFECLDGVDMAIDNPILARRFKDTFIKLDTGSIYPFHYYSNLPALSFDYFDRTGGTIRLSVTDNVFAKDSGPDDGAYIVFAIDQDTQERRLDCHVRLLSTTHQTLIVKFARQGQGRFVEDRREITLAPSVTSELTLSFECKDTYKLGRVFIKPLSGQPGKLKATMRIVDHDRFGLAGTGALVSPAAPEVADLYKLFARAGSAHGLSSADVPAVRHPVDQHQRRYPRLLIIDTTPVGHASATGQVKQALLGDWPAQSWLQIWDAGGSGSQTLRMLIPSQSNEKSRSVMLSVAEIIARCRSFNPDAIYVRPTESLPLLEIAQRVSEALAAPLVVHMMDDWPERLRHASPEKYKKTDPMLRSLIDRSRAQLSISKAMSIAYEARYGGKWTPLANGVRLEDFKPRGSNDRPPISEDAPFVFRYMGALAEDMNLSSMLDVARAISTVFRRLPVRLEIYTMPWFKERAEKELGVLPGVSVFDLVPAGDYYSALCESDALVLAYNFDAESLRYMGLSLANKMPESLAAGVPLLAYGPLEAATIRYLDENGCAVVVKHRDEKDLCTAIESMVRNLSLCSELSQRARRHVAENLNAERVQETFLNTIMTAANAAKRDYPAAGVIASESDIPGPRSKPCIGPFDRESHVHLDETDAVAAINWPVQSARRVMIDVGAHFGTSLAHFLDKGWRIFAFEPDQNNRAKLLERLAKHPDGKLVTLDTRAVSNKSQQGLSFYTSEVSTGISGLSAFHESHHESQHVDVVTLKEFLQPWELSELDFLKIDTEGHDLFVLQGFPWDRLRPRVIECEFEDGKTVPLGYTFHDLAGYLLGKGYTVYVSEWHPIIRYGIRHDWSRLTRYPCGLANSKGWGNLLAFRDGIDENRLVEYVKKVMKADGTAGRKTVQRNEITLSRVEPGRYFRAANGNTWNYTHSDTNDQKIWLAVFDIRDTSAGRSYAASINIKSDKHTTLRLSLGRHGKSKYEGSHKLVTLLPGVAQRIQMRCEFAQSHSALKLQLEVLEPPRGGEMSLSIDSICITETVDSVQQRIGRDAFTLSEANVQFRHGNYATAMAIYLMLYKSRPIHLYADNALMSARKLGIDAGQTVEGILSLCG